MTYLLHVTLDTGHVHRSSRAEASDAAVNYATTILARALNPPAAPPRTAAMLRERGGERAVQIIDLALMAIHRANIIPPGIAAPDQRPLNGWTLNASAEGRCAMMATASRLVDGEMVPAVTFGVARDSRCGAPLWRLLHADITGRGPVATDSSRPPAAPWLGTRLEMGAAHPAWDRQAVDLAALADFERCIAWSWLEMR